MSTTELISQAADLEAQIKQANKATRLSLQPEFDRVIHRLQAIGEPVPSRYWRLNATLVDEVAEDRFDNFPV